jgi:D-serine deaminase-like pyridoxal phosphate-dependent protein
LLNIKKPSFIIDKEKCFNNIRRFVQKAGKHDLIFRPHFKTHQSAVIGEWFRESGVSKIAVSSVGMAQYFASHGWNDITIAMPVNPLQIHEINELASRIRLNIIILSEETYSLLEQHLRFPAGIFIEIDNGYNRTGLIYDEINSIDKLLEKFGRNPFMTFSGFLCHAGNTYTKRNFEEISQIHEDAISKLKKLKELYNTSGTTIISYGDTPSCSLMKNFDGIDEIRPGNFVFYDIMQQQIGSCGFEDISAILAVPVLAKHYQRNEIVVEGGAIHLSKDYITGSNLNNIYGYPVFFDGKTWSVPDGESYVRSLSQEHGVIKCSGNFFDSVKPGDVIGIMPAHSCLTAHQMRNYITTDGEIIGTMNS